MSYATLADLTAAFGVERLIMLTDRINIPPAALDEAVAMRALTEAGALVDGYLSPRYALPIANTPDTAGAMALLAGLVCDIANYKLQRVAPDDGVKLKYDDGLRFLRDIQRGVAELPGVATGRPAGANLVEFAASRRVFGAPR